MLQRLKEIYTTSNDKAQNMTQSQFSSANIMTKNLTNLFLHSYDRLNICLIHFLHILYIRLAHRFSRKNDLHKRYTVPKFPSLTVNIYTEALQFF